MAATFNKAARAAFTIAIERWRVNEEPVFLDNNVSLDFRILLFITFWITFTLECLGTDRYKSDGGWGGFSACTNFFFSAHRRNFFSGEPLCTNFFFQTNILFFEQWNLDSLSMFLCFINYSTLTTDQRIQATLMQNLFENVHTVREEEATWSGRLPCAFFQSLPSGIPLLQPIIMMPYSIHQNSKK